MNLTTEQQKRRKHPGANTAHNILVKYKMATTSQWWSTNNVNGDLGEYIKQGDVTENVYFEFSLTNLCWPKQNNGTTMRCRYISW